MIGDDETVYFGSFDAYLRAVNPDGTEKWRFKAAGSIYSSPAIDDDGTVYFSDNGGTVYGGLIVSYLYALDRSGNLKWKIPFNAAHLTASPAIGEDGTIYIGACYVFYAINPDGTIKWKYENIELESCRSCPAISEDGTIYVTFENIFLAFGPDGKLKWKLHYWRYPPGETTFNPSPAIGKDGTIYVGGDKLQAFDPSGSVKWEYGYGKLRSSNIETSPVIGDGVVYVGMPKYYGDMEYLYVIE